MEDIANISKLALLNLSKRNIDATPSAYEKEFCSLAKGIDFVVTDCEYFKEVLSSLSLDEKKGRKIDTIYDIVSILLNRIEKKNLETMTKLLQKSIKPSIAINISDDLNSFSIKIGDSPSLIFEESIQKEMERYIEERFEVDKKVVAKKTADIARLISLMSKYLGDAIHSNQKGSSNVGDIKKEINSINIESSTKEELNKFQAKLIKAATTIEHEINSVNKTLESGKSEVSKLENRIKELENELTQTKDVSKKDHLTGTLTRRAYEEELKRFDEQYNKAHQDFAIIFFDIDHFKKVNDVYGHEGGDIILKTFASLLLKLTKDIDIVGRFGGEEFIVALHYRNIEELYTYITRIKNVVTKNKFVYEQHKIHITFSAGVEIRSNNDSIESTISNADKHLYQAKETGRNKIITWNKKEF